MCGLQALTLHIPTHYRCCLSVTGHTLGLSGTLGLTFMLLSLFLLTLELYLSAADVLISCDMLHAYMFPDIHAFCTGRHTERHAICVKQRGSLDATAR